MNKTQRGPTVEDTMRAASAAIGLRLTPGQVADAADLADAARLQSVAAGVPEYEAELMGQGFALGYFCALNADPAPSVRPVPQS